MVAVKKGSDIVWSWHIWVTGYDPANDPGWSPVNSGEDTTTRTSYRFMGRNLGASAPGNSLEGRGLFYQWGRKDPFPPKDVSGFGVADGGSGVTIAQAIRNPGTFYYIASGNDYDWLASERDNTLWGVDDEANPKTIYDPCPAGWRVPLSGAGALSPWSGYTTEQTYDGATLVDERGYVLPFDNNGGSYTQSYWPAAGLRNNSIGALVGPGAYGYYWSATVTGAGAYYLYFESDNIGLSDNGGRVNGYSLRCVKE